MTRILVFDGEKAAKRFEFCRVAILSAGNGKGDRTREVVRSEARLLDAFDAISDPGPVESPDTRVLHLGDVRVSLSQADHDVLSKYLDTTPWLPRAARDAVDVQDWCSAAEKQD